MQLSIMVLELQMAKTGTVTVVAEVDGKTLSKLAKLVKVTAGGCGG